MPLYRTGNKLDLERYSVDIEDISPTSNEYFLLFDFNSDFGLGKNSFIINNVPTDIKLEALDSNGNVLYYERANNIDIVNKTNSVVISYHVYQQNASGAGKLIILGTINNKLVRFSSPLNINNVIINKGITRFYNQPILEVTPLLLFSTKPNLTEVNPKTLTGNFYSKAIYPPVNFNVEQNQYNKNIVDYQIINTSQNFNSYLRNFYLTLYVQKIKLPGSSEELSVNETSSILVKNVINTNRLQLGSPFIYNSTTDNKKYVAEIVQGSYSIVYSHYEYSASYFSTSSYVIENTNLIGGKRFKQYSIAEISYRNLDTFSGTVTSHKVYRRSLNIATEYSLILDENFNNFELLKLYNSPIKTFQNLGNFYSQFHINNFWITSSSDINLIHNSSSLIDSVNITGSLNSDDNYIIAKINTANTTRDATYIPFNSVEYTNQSGSSYDCNFIKMLANTEYVISFNANLIKKNINDIATLYIYLTGSYENNKKELAHTTRHGIKLGDLYIDTKTTAKYFEQPFEFVFIPKNDLYGTVVIAPYGFESLILSNLSIKQNTTKGFSPQSYTTRILFPINQPNELFDIKSELYDNESNLIYSNLRTIQQFDPNGSSSAPTFSSGLDISASSLVIQNKLTLENLENWGLTEPGDLVLGLDPITKQVGYYITPEDATGSVDNAISASYALYAESSFSSISSSFANDSISASYALSASYVADANIWHTPPTTPTDYGQEGWMAYTNGYHFIYAGGRWYRHSISDF